MLDGLKPLDVGDVADPRDASDSTPVVPHIERALPGLCTERKQLVQERTLVRDSNGADRATEAGGARQALHPQHHGLLLQKDTNAPDNGVFEPTNGTEVIRVLLVEDDEDDYVIVQDLIDRLEFLRLDVEWASSFETGLTLANERRHDLYLLDYQLGPRTGVELLETIIARDVTAPVIMLTGFGDRFMEIEALRAGAADYLAKGDVTVTVLERSLRYALERSRVAVERRGLEEQLRHGQRLEAVGRLAGGMAHDFNNLLTVISGYTDFLLRDGASGLLWRDYALEIKSAAERAALLTRQLLAFSHKQVLQPKVVDLNTVVTGMHGMLRRLIGEDVDLTLVLGQDLANVLVDLGQIEQVIVNLVVNARDAMPDGGTISVKTARAQVDETSESLDARLASGSQVCLIVADTGSGMTPDVLEHLFEPFFTTKEPGKGTGLGLATVYGIVKQSGGEIRVESRSSAGSTFTITLPCVPEGTPAVETLSADTEPLGGGETVLLVEDDSSVRSLARMTLESYGYSVIEASDGAQALALAARYSQHIHLLVTDMVMPQMKGMELAERLATLRPSLRVLCMSGYTDEPALHNAVLGGTMPFLGKPFTPAALARAVRETLGATDAT